MYTHGGGLYDMYISAFGYGPHKLFGTDLYDKRYLPIAASIRKILRTQINIHGSITCLCSCRLGFGQLFDLVTVKLKETMKDRLTIEMHIPGKMYSASRSDDRYYDKLYRCADRKVIMQDDMYTTEDTIRRDLYILDKSNLVITYYYCSNPYDDNAEPVGIDDDYIKEVHEYTKMMHIPTVNLTAYRSPVELGPVFM